MKKKKLGNNSDNLDIKRKKKISGYGVGMKISLDLISPIVVGFFIGITIDNFFSTKPIFLVIFLVLGIIAGFYNLYKSAQKIDKNT